MTIEADLGFKDRFATVDGVRLRYIEAGAGPPVLLLHGASLGSSADVFLGNLGPLARGGFRVIAFDQPGFGLSDHPDDISPDYRRRSIPRFIAALGLDKVALIGHSQSGSAAAQLVLQEPARYSHLIVLGTTGLLPPLVEGSGRGAREAAAQQRLERRMATSEPTREETRKLLCANLYNHDLITPEVLELRHSRSVGQNFRSFVARSRRPDAGPPPLAGTDGPPLWERALGIEVPTLMIYGKDDRAKAFERASRLTELHPDVNLHIVERCKHLVHWDAAAEFHRLAVAFLREG